MDSNEAKTFSNFYMEYIFFKISTLLFLTEFLINRFKNFTSNSDFLFFFFYSKIPTFKKSIDTNCHCIWQWQTTTHSTIPIHLDTLFHTHTHTHRRTHFSIPSNRSFWWRAAPRRSVPVLSSHSSFFPPRYILSGRISSSFLFLQRASSSRLFFIEFLPTTAARRDYLWPLETIEERCKHTRIHFRIHPPPPSMKRD